MTVENPAALSREALEQEGIKIRAGVPPVIGGILSAEALRFVAGLARRFEPRRRELLASREKIQEAYDAGRLPDFLPETREIRESPWAAAPIPKDLSDRRVEITGPADRKLVINALNSGAKVFMADFEDSHSPVWSQTISGQQNFFDAVRRSIEHISPEGHRYALNNSTAILMARPRGWHLVERGLTVDGAPMSASLFDFGLSFFHNAKELVRRGSGPYFYIPKLESRLEARLWNDVFVHSQAQVGLARGTIRATVLIETIGAAFEMDEILYELREHSAGLNCGRWDYIFSFIKKFSAHSRFVLPDRAQVTMMTPFLRAYSRLLIKTCHRRGVHAMGGMAAQIPIKSDPKANEEALAKVREDKEREAGDGHDGTWVAHPGLVETARSVFDRMMPFPNQIKKSKDAVVVGSKELLEVPAGRVTEGGLRLNLRVGVRYLAAWLSGSGCVPLFNLMEDAATAEISRAQVWQWTRHGVKLDDGRIVEKKLVDSCLREELAGIRRGHPYGEENLRTAAEIFEEIIFAPKFPPFLTLRAYEYLK